MTKPIGSQMTCECELRQRAWNPNTGRCQTCGARYEDHRIDGHRAGKERTP